MSTTNEPEVKIVERSEVTPAGDDEETVESPDSSQEETTEEETEESESEATEESEEETEEPKPAPQNAAAKEDEKYGDIKPLAGESQREFALRIENARLREDIRKGKVQEILTPPSPQVKKELSPEKKKVLEKYKPEDIQTLKEVMDVMADDLGFVKKDQLGASTYQEKASEVLDEFLEKHPEYQPQNDPGNVLWNRFKEEFSIYRQPDSPRALKKILDKIHKDVFGIKPAAALNKQDAAKEKIKVASHSSSSRPAPSREGVKRTATPQGLRLDMLKGFSEDEIAELGGE